MRSKNSKRLVIDADVAQASGDEDATDPRAIICRDILMEVRTQEHRIVMTRLINDEWKRHQSHFALEWRASMDARRRVVRIDTSEQSQLKRKLTNTTENVDDNEVMQKDFHLIQAALETDKTIISLDETARVLFAVSSQQVGEIRNIIWVNPERTAEELPTTWVKNGALPEVHRQLSEYQPSK